MLLFLTKIAAHVLLLIAEVEVIVSVVGSESRVVMISSVGNDEGGVMYCCFPAVFAMCCLLVSL